MLPKFELVFIRQQNQLNQLLSRDVEYGCALTVVGILNNWSNETWRKFNLYACLNVNLKMSQSISSFLMLNVNVIVECNDLKTKHALHMIKIVCCVNVKLYINVCIAL